MIEMIQQQYAESGAFSTFFFIVTVISAIALLACLAISFVAKVSKNENTSTQFSKYAMVSLAVVAASVFLGATVEDNWFYFILAIAGIALVAIVFMGASPRHKTPFDDLGPAAREFFSKTFPKKNKGKKAKKNGKSRSRQVAVDDLLD